MVSHFLELDKARQNMSRTTEVIFVILAISCFIAIGNSKPLPTFLNKSLRKMIFARFRSTKSMLPVTISTKINEKSSTSSLMTSSLMAKPMTRTTTEATKEYSNTKTSQKINKHSRKYHLTTSLDSTTNQIVTTPIKVEPAKNTSSMKISKVCYIEQYEKCTLAEWAKFIREGGLKVDTILPWHKYHPKAPRILLNWIWEFLWFCIHGDLLNKNILDISIIHRSHYHLAKAKWIKYYVL